MLIKPNGGLLRTVETVDLSRDQIRLFQDFEAMCRRMGLSFGMRCNKCLEAGDPDNGVRGNNESNASQYVVECNCTRRVYRGADVRLV